jgi:Pyruvate/2-oxoacid:ferredoxin oxidoreductase delta subunit
MCEFCKEHGEGKKWFLNAKNYSEELLNDPERMKFIKSFYGSFVENSGQAVSRIEKMVEKNPAAIKRFKSPGDPEQKKNHWGQVITLEEVSEILNLTNSIVRYDCGCMYQKEKKEGRYCFGISFSANTWYHNLDLDYFGKPDTSLLEEMNKEDALSFIKSLDQKGMVHSVWTLGTPFIGAVCNCDMQYCIGMRASYKLGITSMFKGESLALIDGDACDACKECRSICQVNAISDSADGVSAIDAEKCIGCGTCRSVCEQHAISLVQRDSTAP